MKKDTRTLKEKSFHVNMDNFLNKISDIEIFKLSNYLASHFIDTPPDKLQQEFIEEFFGTFNWAIFIDNENKKREGTLEYLVPRPNFDLPSIREYLMFKITIRFGDLILQVSKLEMNVAKLNAKNLKEKFKLATVKSEIILSFLLNKQDGGFNKIDGFSDIYEILIRHKLINKMSDD